MSGMRKKTKPVYGLKPPKRGKGKGKILSQRSLRLVERRFQIVTLRRDGYSYKEIADTLGCSMATISEDLRECLKQTIEVTSETTAESREIQVQRLDLLIKTYTPLATQIHNEVRINAVTGQEVIITVPPDPKYANLILAIESRRAKLLSLDVPEVKKLEVSGIREYVGVDMDKI